MYLVSGDHKCIFVKSRLLYCIVLSWVKFGETVLVNVPEKRAIMTDSHCFMPSVRDKSS